MMIRFPPAPNQQEWRSGCRILFAVPEIVGSGSSILTAEGRPAQEAGRTPVLSV
jgi:hypothetical protein